MNERPIGLRDQQFAARATRNLCSSASGVRYINSAEYTDYMVELVSRYYEPDESFFGLLVGVTATFLSDTDPYAEDADVFDEFVSDNMSLIRAAIDRIKAVKPEITLAERSWEQTRLEQTSRS